MKKYDIKLFRYVKHPPEESSAYCRHCKWQAWSKTAPTKARYHAKNTLHTVDVYIEVHKEITSRNNKIK